MHVSERLELISKIGRELQDRYTFSDLYSYLAAFQIPRIPDGPTESKWKYAKLALDGQNNEMIITIAGDLGLSVSDSASIVLSTNKVELPKNWQDTRKFRLFISHLAKNKDKATRIKSALDELGICAFVAHEDIHPTLVWQNEIEKSLNTMEAMVAIHTKGFSKSFWTQQEIGFALGRSTYVISLKMGEDPTGFISIHQALIRRKETAEDIAVMINDLLYADKRTNGRLTEAQRLNRNPFETAIVSDNTRIALAYQNKLDYEELGPKMLVPRMYYAGVQIESRYSVASELADMRAIIDRMPLPVLERVLSIWCDSKAGSIYNIHLTSDFFTDDFAQEVSKAIVGATGGYNGVYFEGSENLVEPLDPEWLGYDG